MIEKDITVVETNYTDYGIVLKYKNMNKEYTQVALYGELMRILLNRSYTSSNSHTTFVNPLCML